MNIFALSSDPGKSARMMCDRHVVKMIVESAQMLSTAHRVLDGEEYVDRSGKRSVKRWNLNAPRDALYKATHINHPSSVWARFSNNNYIWLYCHFDALCEEYTFRYKKIHATEQKLLDILSMLPYNINIGYLTPIPQAMPDQYKQSLTVDAYRAYYLGEKSGFAKWTKREIPDWWQNKS